MASEGSEDDEPERRERSSAPAAPVEAAPIGAPRPASPSALRRFAKVLILLGGVGLVLYFAGRAPHEQHVRVVLGDAAREVTGLELEYTNPQGEVMRTAELRFSPGTAPRIVPHEPSLPNGDYRLRIEVDAREGRRTVERQVTLGGGSTQVDVSRVLSAPPSP